MNLIISHQWGEEGKGRVSEFRSARSNLSCKGFHLGRKGRFQLQPGVADVSNDFMTGDEVVSRKVAPAPEGLLVMKKASSFGGTGSGPCYFDRFGLDDVT